MTSPGEDEDQAAETPENKTEHSQSTDRKEIEEKLHDASKICEDV